MKRVIVLFLAALSYFRRITIITSSNQSLFGLFSRKTRFVQYALEIWDDLNKSGVAKVKSPRLLKRYQNQVQFLLCPLKERLDLVKHHYPHAQSFVVQNCPPLQNSQTKDKPSKKVVLYSGMIKEISNGTDLLSVVEKLDESIEIHLAGDTAPELRQAVLQLTQSKPNIHYHGYLKATELLALRSRCNIGLLTWTDRDLTTKLASPNKLYEYIANALYVASFPNFSIRNLNQKYHFGFVGRSDPQELVMHLNNLSLDEVYRVAEVNSDLYLNGPLNYEAQIDGFIKSFRSNLL